MKAFNKKMKQERLRNSVQRVMLLYAEHFDLVMLYTLHNKKGYGAKRLRDFYKDFLETYDTYKGRYFDETDIEEFGSRTDTYALKEHLKQIGFDYDK